MGSDDEAREEVAGLEADLEADLEELEREFSVDDDQGDAQGAVSPGPADPGPSPGAPDVTAPVAGAGPLFGPDELEDEVALAWGAAMKLYARRVLDLDPDDIPEGTIDAESAGEKISPRLAAVANKWLPYISSRWSEEIALGVALASASSLTIWELNLLAQERDTEGDAEPAEVE